MGCFFDCFRIRHDRTEHRPHLIPNNEEESQKIHLSSLFAAEEQEESVVKDRENLVRRVGRSEVVEGLVEEAMFLKACGALPETPAEIRKAVNFAEKLEISDIQSPNMVKFSPETPADIRQAEHAEKSVRLDSQGPPFILEFSPETPEEIQRTDCTANWPEKSDLRRAHSVLKYSPYPTPRKITDDMQTPGTVFATNMNSLTRGNARIRSQYVYTVLNPIENLCAKEELTEENPFRNEQSDIQGEHVNATPYLAVGSDKNSIKKENLGDVSLSSWLKPPRSSDDADRQNLDAVTSRKPNIGRTVGDRPIIGLVSTLWDERVETSHISAKWWDGNGIPNSTTKYKEDQKVCWHATPFEERLEKALSEEALGPHRKPISGTPIVFEEAEENDSATSELQSMKCSKSVMSS